MQAAVQAVNYRQGFDDAWRHVATTIPHVLAFAVLLVVTLVVASVLARVVDTALRRIGFDRLVVRSGLPTRIGGRYDPSAIVGRIVYFAVLLAGLSMSFAVFGPNPISAYLAAIVAYLPKVIVAIVMVVVAGALAKWAKEIVTESLAASSYGSLLGSLTGGLIMALGVIAALNQLDIAKPVVLAVLYAGLAALVGVTIVGVGGGLIRPMSQRWENALQKVSEESSKVSSTSTATAAGHPVAYPYEPAGASTLTQQLVTPNPSPTRGR